MTIEDSDLDLGTKMIGTEVIAQKYTFTRGSKSREFYIAKLDDGSILMQFDDSGCYHLPNGESIDIQKYIHV